MDIYVAFVCGCLKKYVFESVSLSVCLCVAYDKTVMEKSGMQREQTIKIFFKRERECETPHVYEGPNVVRSTL